MASKLRMEVSIIPDGKLEILMVRLKYLKPDDSVQGVNITFGRYSQFWTVIDYSDEPLPCTIEELKISSDHFHEEVLHILGQRFHNVHLIYSSMRSEPPSEATERAARNIEALIVSAKHWFASWVIHTTECTDDNCDQCAFIKDYVEEDGRTIEEILAIARQWHREGLDAHMKMKTEESNK